MADSNMTSSDEALALSAENEIRNYSGVRVWADALSLLARNGVVEIGGYVRTRAEREVTENVVLKTKGVKDVISHLYVDTDLEIAAGKALGDDARTRGGFPGILVGCAFGDVYLKGSVPSADMKKVAAEIVGKVDGVRTVINTLEASETAKPAAATPKPGVVAAKPAVTAGTPVTAMKPPTPGAVKPSVTPVKPPAAARPGITPMKPPAAGSVKSSVTAVKPPSPDSVKPSVTAPEPLAADAVEPSVAVVEPPAPDIVKPTVTPVKPPAASRPGITPMKPPAPGSVKSSVTKPPAPKE